LGLFAAVAQAESPPLAGVPRLVDPRPLGVGRLVADASAIGIDGERRSLAALLGPRATVVAMTSAACPLARKFAPVLARLEKELAPLGVGFVFVNADASDTPDAAREQVAAQGWKGSYLLDRAGAIAG